MKKKGRNKKSSYIQRDNSYISKRSLLNDIYKLNQRGVLFSDDGRHYHPEKQNRRKYDNLGRFAATTYSVPRSQSFKDVVRDIPRFANPRPVLVCRRRRFRRIALFALNIIGKGKGGSGKKRRMTEDSKISCKR